MKHHKSYLPFTIDIHFRFWRFSLRNQWIDLQPTAANEIKNEKLKLSPENQKGKIEKKN